MSNAKKQRTKIEDLPDDGNELFDLSEEMLMMVGVFGGSGSSSCPEHHDKGGDDVVFDFDRYKDIQRPEPVACSSTQPQLQSGSDVDYC